MGRVGAYLQVERAGHDVRPAHETIADFDEFVSPLSAEEQREQASRCMNCGVAFCQSGVPLGGSRVAVGCPLHNLIPETNDLLYRGCWDDAAARLSLTNPFPEFTSRVCPAPCETACNLGLNEDSVTIHDNERALSDYAWEHDMVEPLAPAPEDAQLVSVIGSGPAGLAVAWELVRHGKRVRVYEKADRPGGLLMYGIPNMKLAKDVVERRIKLMEESGIEFACGVDATQKAGEIAAESDAVIIAAGCGIPRDVAIDGRELAGIEFAVDYLTEATRALLEGRDADITADGKDVVVIGGGDTGVDCVATALRQGAKSVTQVIRAQCPPDVVETHGTWPAPRTAFSQSYGHREAQAVHGEDPRVWSTDTIAFCGDDAVESVRVAELSYDGGRHVVEGTERDIPAQLVLIAKGFVSTDTGLFDAFGVDVPERGGEAHLVREASSDVPAVYVAGDARMGATLVATAIADALACAEEVIDEL